VASAAITAILVNLSFGPLFDSYVKEQESARGVQVAAVLADSYRRHHSWNYSEMQAMGPTLLMDGGEVQVTDSTGVVVWQLSGDPNSDMVRLHRELTGSRLLGQTRRVPIRVDGELVGIAAMRLPAPGLQPHDIAFRNGVNQMLLVGGMLAGIVALALGIILSRHASVPVRQLTAAANAWAGGNRRQRVDYQSDDEYGAMAVSFNTMADSLEDQEQLRRAFASNIAHELRTPLMVLRSQVEAMQDGVMERNDSSIESLHEEILGLSRLVADLEVLASAAAARFGLERRPIDLGEQVLASVHEFQLLYPDRTIKAELTAAQVTIEGDPGRMRQVVSNLLSNALKFTPKGGQVRVILTSSEAEATLEISDSGPGIPEEELEAIFDHFFRGRRARPGGSGIGLTVVRELVSAHGGSVHALSHVGIGAVFRVILPLASIRPHPAISVTPSDPVAAWSK